jgi:tetratricopeptide (TPR) repeat protein
MVAFGSFLADTGRGDEAMRWWEKALAADPHAAAAYNNIANHYGHTGRAGDALRYYAKAIALVPEEPMYRYNWAVTCSLFRKDAQQVYGWDEAEIFRRSLAQFCAARDLAPRDPSYAGAYAETFYMMKNPDWREAYAAWQVSLERAPDDGARQVVCGHLARVCMHLERYAEAKQWIEKMDGPEPGSMRRALERKLAELVDTAGGARTRQSHDDNEGDDNHAHQ